MDKNDGAASLVLVRSDALLARIEKLRDEWAGQAWGIERTHGDDDPGGKAIRGCIGDLARAVEEVQKGEATMCKDANKPSTQDQQQAANKPATVAHIFKGLLNENL